MANSMDNISRQLAREAPFTGNLEQDSEVFKYAIKILLLNATALAGIVLISRLLGILPVTLTIWAAAFSLRVFAGGRHRTGPVSCWILTMTTFTVAGYLLNAGFFLFAKYATLLVALGLVFTLFVVVSNAPVTVATKKFTAHKKQQLKMASVAVVVFWAAIALAPRNLLTSQPIQPIAITMGLIIQSISIFKFNLKSR